MRVLVVVESMFGNTEAIGRRIAHALGHVAEVEVVDAARAPADPGPDVDLVVIGAPTHAFSLPSPRTRDDAVRQGAPAERDLPGVREWLAVLPAGRRFAVAAFDTRLRGAPRHPRGAIRAIGRRARRSGARVIGTAEFLVEGTRGPVTDGELDRAARWAEDLVPALQHAR